MILKIHAHSNQHSSDACYELKIKMLSFVASVRLEPATSLVSFRHLFHQAVRNLAHNLSDNGRAMGIYSKATGGRGAVGGQASGQRELG